MIVTAFDIAQRYAGVGELPGAQDHPLIQWWLSLCGFALDSHDEIPWCSAFCQHAPWELRLPRSKSALARSWLGVGRTIALSEVVPGFDVVILQRGAGVQPGPENQTAPGHVGFYAGYQPPLVQILGGNQSNKVSIESFPYDRVLGVRRLAG